jgi:hypothetical protein
MRQKVIGHFLASTYRLLENLWEMSKEYWRPSRQCLNRGEDILGNVQIVLETLHFFVVCQRLSDDEKSASKSCWPVGIKETHTA